MGKVIWNIRFTPSPLTDAELAACRALAAFKRWHWQAMGVDRRWGGAGSVEPDQLRLEGR
jgi:hypothetical protein